MATRGLGDMSQDEAEKHVLKSKFRIVTIKLVVLVLAIGIVAFVFPNDNAMKSRYKHHLD
jgi:hypothetical protein